MPVPMISDLCIAQSERIQGKGALSDTVYGRIRNDILFGRLHPGAKLKLDRLKAVYEAGISTLRETLTRLAAEGFVVAEGQKGFRVAPTSMENLWETADLRLTLECHALRISIERGDIEWEERIVCAYHKLAKTEALAFKGEDVDTQTWKLFDRDFHAALVSACGSKTLLRVHRAIYDQYLRYQVIALMQRPPRREAAAEEHHLILKHALDRDADGTTKILARHIRSDLDARLGPKADVSRAMPPRISRKEKDRHVPAHNRC